MDEKTDYTGEQVQEIAEKLAMFVGSFFFSSKSQRQT